MCSCPLFFYQMQKLGGGSSQQLALVSMSNRCGLLCFTFGVLPVGIDLNLYPNIVIGRRYVKLQLEATRIKITSRFKHRCISPDYVAQALHMLAMPALSCPAARAPQL